MTPICHFGRFTGKLYGTASLFVAALGLPAGALAEGFLRGPVSGLVYDRAGKSIHRIDGIPGGAVLSRAIPLGIEVNAAAFDRNQRFAVVADSEGSAFLVRDPAGEVPRAEPLAGALKGVQLVALDRDGSHAALYSPALASLQILEGLPDAPKIILTSELRDSAPSLSFVALLPEGSGALIVSASGGASTVFKISPQGGLEAMARAGSVRSLVVLGSADFVYIDSERNELVKVHGAGAGAEQTVLAGAPDGVNGPRGVCALPDGGLVVVNAGGGGPAAMFFDPQGRPSASMELAFEPQGCGTPGAGPWLLLNEAGRGPLYLLDYSEGARVMFVPAAPAEATR